MGQAFISFVSLKVLDGKEKQCMIPLVGWFGILLLYSFPPKSFLDMGRGKKQDHRTEHDESDPAAWSGLFGESVASHLNLFSPVVLNRCIGRAILILGEKFERPTRSVHR